MDPINLKSPLKMNIFILTLGGLWPKGDKNVAKSVYSFYGLFSFVFIVFSHVCSQVINVYFIYDKLETLTASIVVMLTEGTGMVKFVLFYRNIKIVKRLMTMLDDPVFQPKTSEEKIFVEKSLQNWKQIYLGFSISSVMTLLLWSLYPLINGSYKEKNLPFIAWYPYDDKKSPLYEFTYIYQVIANYFIAIVNQNVDAFISALLMYISVQCKLFCSNLKNLENKLDKSYFKFIESIKHHQKILRFAKNTEDVLSIIAYVQFMTSVIAVCMTMFQLTVIFSLRVGILLFPFKVTPLTPEFYTLVCCQSAVLTQVFVYCWFGNEVIVESNKIPFAGYQSEFWLSLPTHKQKDLTFFLMKTNKPIKLRAVNFFALSLETFMAILKTSWSYFALLRQMNY